MKNINKVMFLFFMFGILLFFQDGKVHATTDLELNYSLDSIIVVLNEEDSLINKEYTANDFKEINCTKVNDLTKETKNKINDGRLVIGRDIEKFHRILCLELDCSNEKDLFDKIGLLRMSNKYYSVEPNYKLKLCEYLPDDYDAFDLNGMVECNFPNAWDECTGSSSVYVGIIDSGIDVQHLDLVDNLDTPLFRDCRNGIATYSLDYMGNHGTQVAGIIGACGNNGMGVAGCCWDVKMVSMRVFDNDDSAVLSKLLTAIDYAESQNIKLLNYSGIVYTSGSEDILSLMSALQNYSGLFICSAGNGNPQQDISVGLNLDNDNIYPAKLNLKNLISVGGYTDQFLKHGSSNYGKNTVDLFAPWKEQKTTWSTSLGSYGSFTGTSAAAPFVTGAAALLMAKYPELTPAMIKKVICDNVMLPQGPSLNDPSPLLDYCISGGVLDAGACLSNCAILTKSTNHNLSSNLCNGKGLFSFYQNDSGLVRINTAPYIGINQANLVANSVTIYDSLGHVVDRYHSSNLENPATNSLNEYQFDTFLYGGEHYYVEINNAVNYSSFVLSINDISVTHITNIDMFAANNGFDDEFEINLISSSS